MNEELRKVVGDGLLAVLVEDFVIKKFPSFAIHYNFNEPRFVTLEYDFTVTDKVEYNTWFHRYSVVVTIHRHDRSCFYVEVKSKVLNYYSKVFNVSSCHSIMEGIYETLLDVIDAVNHSKTREYNAIKKLIEEM